MGRVGLQIKRKHIQNNDYIKTKKNKMTDGFVLENTGVVKNVMINDVLDSQQFWGLCFT